MQTSKVLMRQLAMEHQGGQQQYQSFKKTIDASPLLYKHNLDEFTDQIPQRHSRNISQINYLKQLLNSNKLSTDMLSTNTYNTYYPSYVLHHHHHIFIPILKNVSKSQDTKELLKKAKKNQIVGAFLNETKRTDFKQSSKDIPSINSQGFIQMEKNVYYYSLASSPYITHAAFLAHNHQKQKCLVIIRIRDNQGRFVESINFKDLGGLISKDYLPIAYNFSNTKPLLVLSLQNKVEKKIISKFSLQQLAEFNFSLKDLQKSLWITNKYTSMRGQFKTIEGSKEERKIISYQAVAARIINAFAQFQALSDLFTLMQITPKANPIYADLTKSAHHNILDHLIHLRECCGGFGYLQFSGHPGCIQRVCARSGRQSQVFPQSQLSIIQFYAGNQQVHKYFSQEISDQDVSYMKYFSLFLSICGNMRESKNKLLSFEFRRQFLKQVGILSMHRREEFLRHESDNVHFQLLHYHLLTYIEKHSSFIDWKLVLIDRKKFFSHLKQQKHSCFQAIVPKLGRLCETLELNFLRNTIVGREDSMSFYEQLIEASRKNKRNSEDYVKYIRQPVIDMLVENRAKL